MFNGAIVSRDRRDAPRDNGRRRIPGRSIRPHSDIRTRACAFPPSQIAGSLWPAEAIVRAQLKQSLSMFFFGSSWPVRLWGREEWGTMMFNATQLIYMFLVPAMIVQDDPTAYFRPQYHNERHLAPARRKIADAFVIEIAEAFSGGLLPIRHASSHYTSASLAQSGGNSARLRELDVEYPIAAQEEMRESTGANSA